MIIMTKVSAKVNTANDIILLLVIIMFFLLLLLCVVIITRKCTTLNRRASYTKLITFLAIILKYFYLQPLPFFFISDSFRLASLSRSRLLFNRFTFLPRCMYNTTARSINRATPARVKCAIRCAVRVILRRARECTI